MSSRFRDTTAGFSQKLSCTIMTVVLCEQGIQIKDVFLGDILPFNYDDKGSTGARCLGLLLYNRGEEEGWEV